MLVFFLIQFVNLNFSQDHSVLIHWKEDQPLQWEDFQGKPDRFNIYFKDKEAASEVEIKAESFWRKGLPDFKIQTIFYKKESWTRDKKDMVLLQHEQLHFDIAELYSRKMKKVIYNLRSEEVDDMNVYLEKIRELISQRNAEDEQYDKETQFGTLRERQMEWNDQIEEKLNLLKGFEE